MRQWPQSRGLGERSSGSSKQMFEGRRPHRGRDRRWQEEAREGGGSEGRSCAAPAFKGTVPEHFFPLYRSLICLF